ncbi:elongator complex protein 3, partial [Schnuerera sp.]|uniref:elongator complex protein 3 n=1 Tax=Schnuerera sp. TaxID=2794844 RepID=UPI002B62DDAB
DLLKKYGVDTIELGVQSLDDTVLNRSGRGHNRRQVYMASKLIKEYNFNLGLQMMIGLVGDSKEKAIYTAKEFIKINPYCVRIYPTLVIKDTFLEKMYQKNSYKPLSLEEAIDISAHLLMLFEYHNINVIRVGLQPTENIQLGKDVVAGPFHPSFRQLVESYIYRIILEKHLEPLKNNIIEKNMVVKVNNKNISNLVGQKSSNTNYLLHKYRLKSIKVYSKDIENDIISISIGEFYDKIYRSKTIEEYLKKKGII